MSGSQLGNGPARDFRRNLLDALQCATPVREALTFDRLASDFGLARVVVPTAGENKATSQPCGTWVIHPAFSAIEPTPGLGLSERNRPAANTSLFYQRIGFTAEGNGIIPDDLVAGYHTGDPAAMSLTNLAGQFLPQLSQDSAGRIIEQLDRQGDGDSLIYTINHDSPNTYQFYAKLWERLAIFAQGLPVSRRRVCFVRWLQRRLAVNELADDYDDSTTRHGHQSELVDCLNQLRSFTEYNARDFATVVDHFRKLCFIRPVFTLQRMLIECITKPLVTSTLFAVMHELGYTNCTGHCSRGSADSLTQVNIPVLLHAFQCLLCDQYPDNPGVLEALADFAVRSLDPPADLPVEDQQFNLPPNYESS
ncbi:hypothetical protein IWQ60_007739 [Tieghemiomyces parasiticus]|uniref:Uncharacterized protein n=1 Tax=Tieghemiomyces parasiticus TaxID=78921 RepID=A0A9W7ZVS8_9FUNG|nr:hypothetical protein IWQ60_007739 [Tieghemiomyces parasiticus]